MDDFQNVLKLVLKYFKNGPIWSHWNWCFGYSYAFGYKYCNNNIVAIKAL